MSEFISNPEPINTLFTAQCSDCSWSQPTHTEEEANLARNHHEIDMMVEEGTIHHTYVARAKEVL